MRCDRLLRAVLAVVIASLAGACNEARCIRRSDCNPGFTCSATGLCEAAPDAGPQAPEPEIDAGSGTDTSTAADAAVDATPDAQ